MYEKPLLELCVNSSEIYILHCFNVQYINFSHTNPSKIMKNNRLRA